MKNKLSEKEYRQWEDIGEGLGIIIFPHSRAFTPVAKDQLLAEIQ